MVRLSIWFLINFIAFIIFCWKITQSSLTLPILFGGLGFLLILFNWTRHAVFSTLRSKIPRKRKIFFAKTSKRILPFHRWIGSTAFILILFHVYLVIDRYGFHHSSWKMMTGLLALLCISFVVGTGWYRFYRPSYPIRITHLIFGMALFIAIMTHLLM